MKKVVILSNSFISKNGWGTVAFNLSNQLKKNKNYDVFELEVYCKFNKWYKGLLNIYNYLKVFFFNYKKITSSDYIICVCEPLFFLGYIAKIFNKKIILLIYGYGTYIYTPFVKFPKKYLYLFFSKKIDYIIVSSEFSLKKLREWYKGKASVISLGVSVNEYFPIELKKEFDFIYVGALKKRKGFEVLFEAFKKLLIKFPNARLCIVAKKPKFTSKTEDIFNLIKSNNLIFKEKVSHKDLIELYSKSKCNILPSVNLKYSFEGFGLVHLEANACGIPSIGTSQSANEDIIKNNYNGFLCKQNDILDLYEKMKIIVENSAILKEMSKNAIDNSKRFSWEKTAEKLFDVMEGKKH
ncbi:MAG: glycosyltransferase family 4 protein [Candidatus Muirbacterium halophilum]|nr:glycosyltransferase family 4 protein [Candidatus Muirbacterium halophilum]MCK9474944.1 glycosyltransferase family 4 protein [Candidatus Muirbacterium halophilum]